MTLLEEPTSDFPQKTRDSLTFRQGWHRACSLPTEADKFLSAAAWENGVTDLALEAERASPIVDCEGAIVLQLAGKLDAAERAYQSILQSNPSNPVANHCLGMLELQRRRPEQAVPFLLKALNESPEIPDYWLGYLEALLQSGRMDCANEVLQMGGRCGLSGLAVESFAERLRAATAREHALRSSGSAAAAAAPRMAVVGLEAQSARLARLIADQNIPEAIDCATVLSVQYPDHGLTWKRLGALLWWQGRHDDAYLPMQNAARLLPQDAEALSNFGMAMFNRKLVAEAMDSFRRATALDPRFAPAHYHLGMAYLEKGRYAEGQACLGRATQLRPEYLTDGGKPAYSDLLYLYNHDPSFSPDRLFKEHRRFGATVERQLRAKRPRLANTKDPERPLRIGFVSGDLLDHSVGMFLESVVAHLAQRTGLELHAYYNRDTEDAVTARLRSQFACWSTVVGLSDEELAGRVTADSIDILVDLSGHTALNRLRTFAYKPAPVQVSWLGYPATTGLSTMDYYLADPCWLPPGRFDAQFTEKLVYLPDRWAFVPHPAMPAVNALPALSAGHIRFGSFHRLGKLNAATIGLWARLLRALPHSILLVAGIPMDGAQVELTRAFEACGVDGSRLLFKGRFKMEAYLALHHDVDIALDTQPYAGATTAMHSLAMGVPSLTVAGNTSAGRACAGILAHVGMEDFIAATADGFVERGLYWAGHLSRLADVRAGLRSRLLASEAAQPELIAAHLAAALRRMWRRWCAGRSPTSFHSSLEERS